MTFNEYDQKCENIKRIENTKTGWYPSVEDIDKRILPNIEHYLDYLIWLTETSGEPFDEEAFPLAAGQRLRKTIVETDTKYVYNSLNLVASVVTHFLSEYNYSEI